MDEDSAFVAAQQVVGVVFLSKEDLLIVLVWTWYFP